MADAEDKSIQNLPMLFNAYFRWRNHFAGIGAEWKPSRVKIYLTREAYENIINDEAFGQPGGPDIVLLARPQAKRFMGMKIEVVEDNGSGT